MRFLVAATAVVTACLCDFASAGGARVNGPGARTCGEYLSDRDGPRRNVESAMYVAWTIGYLSAYNMDSATNDSRPQLTLPSDGAVLGYFDKYCAANPLKNLMPAVLNMVDELSGRKPRL